MTPELTCRVMPLVPLEANFPVQLPLFISFHPPGTLSLYPFRSLHSNAQRTRRRARPNAARPPPSSPPCCPNHRFFPPFPRSSPSEINPRGSPVTERRWRNVSQVAARARESVSSVPPSSLPPTLRPVALLPPPTTSLRLCRDARPHLAPGTRRSSTRSLPFAVITLQYMLLGMHGCWGMARRCKY